MMSFLAVHKSTNLLRRYPVKIHWCPRFNYINQSTKNRQKNAIIENYFKLTKLQQKALISFYALSFIVQFSPSELTKYSSSLRERLTNRDIFKGFIKSSHTGKRELKLDEDCIDEVLSGFEITSGAKYNQKVFSQKGFKMAQIIHMISKSSSAKTTSQHHRIILNPLSYTGQIINKIINERAILISGEKGTGKSFTYLIYTYLYQFILQLRTSPEYDGDLPIFHFINKQSFERLPHLSYLSLKQCNSFSAIISVLEQQNQKRKPLVIPKHQMQMGEYAVEQYKYEKYLEQIMNSDNSRDIQFKGIVIDEANQYYSLLKQIARNSQSPENMKINNEERIKQLHYARRKATFISDIMSEAHYFYPNIHNSSQNVDRRLIKEFHSNYQRAFYNLFENQPSKLLEHKIDFKSYLCTQEGQIQLYGVLWFQIECRLRLNGVSEKQIKLDRQKFNHFFALPKQIEVNSSITKQQTNQTIKNTTKFATGISLWNKDIRYLNIRSVVAQIPIQQLIQYFSNENYEIQLMQIRNNIEKHRQELFQE